jgi:hypothetical protein
MSGNKRKIADLKEGEWSKLKDELTKKRKKALEATQSSINAADTDEATDRHLDMMNAKDAFKTALNDAIEAATAEAAMLKKEFETKRDAVALQAQRANEEVAAMLEKAKKAKSKWSLLLCVERSMQHQGLGLPCCDRCGKPNHYSFSDESKNLFYCPDCFAKQQVPP